MQYVKPQPPKWEGPEHMAIINPVLYWMIIVLLVLVHMKSFVVAMFLVSDIRVSYAAVELDELNAIGLIGPWKNQRPGGTTKSKFFNMPRLLYHLDHMIQQTKIY